MSESVAAGADTTNAATTSAAADGGEGTTTATPAEGTLLTGETTAGQQTPGTSTEAEGKTEGEQPAAKVAPETYTDFTLPEGIQLDATVVDEIKGLAKELGVSQEAAQKIADVAAKSTQAVATQQADTVKSIQDGWIAETKADKEIGGDALDTNLAKARAAMEATTTPQLRMLLAKTGLGNNPEVIRHFLKIAPAFASDSSLPSGQAPSDGTKSAAKVLYPNNA